MKKHYFALPLVFALFAITAQGAGAQTPSAATSATSAAPADNSKANTIDSTNTTATADAQKDNANDRTITQSIHVVQPVSTTSFYAL